MSAYVVNNRTISAVVKGFLDYGVDFSADDYEKPIQVLYNENELATAIGQSLLNQNYKSVNYRYREDTPATKFEYVKENYNAGEIFGCIRCYNYQACETDDYFESNLYYSLQNLQIAMLKRYIEKDGFEMPWGLD